MGASYVYNFEVGNYTCIQPFNSSDTSYPASISKMSGLITTSASSIAANATIAVDISSSKVTSGVTNIIITKGNGCPSIQLMYVEIPSTGFFTAFFKNKGTTPCNTEFTFYYLLINS